MTARQFFPESRRRLVHAAEALMLVTVAVLLTAGCAGEKQNLPSEKYIFLEHDIRTEGKTLAGDCSPVAYTSGPTYFFDEQNGMLSTIMSSDNSINESLLLLYVSGESETSSARTGGGGSAYPVYMLPRTMRDNLTIISITPEGIVTMDYQDISITLKPKERWSVNTTPIVRDGCPGYPPSKCKEEIVITDSIYNAGLFDKQNIKAY